MARSFAAVSLLVIIGAGAALAVMPPPGSPAPVRPASPAKTTVFDAIRRGEPQELIVTLKPAGEKETNAAVKTRVFGAAAPLSRTGVRTVRDFSMIPVIMVEVPNGKALDALLASPDVAGVEVNGYVYPMRPGAATAGATGTAGRMGAAGGSMGSMGTAGGSMGTMGSMGTAGGSMGTMGSMGTAGGSMGTMGSMGTAGGMARPGVMSATATPTKAAAGAAADPSCHTASGAAATTKAPSG